ncbi:MAG: hypothetical protein JRE64_02875 [Deltaproteobacteria bacterium]|nr:hypothetical protein [Deltaproteobacteria bacterium]
MTEEYHPYKKNRMAFERDENKNVFVIMRYAPESPLDEIENAIKNTLRRFGLNAILAREKIFDDELWSNVRFCMDHSRYAIVVFERLIQPDFNPNIILELGYMMAIRRPCLILKEKSLPTLNTDIIGRLYTPFDSHKALETVSSAIEGWLQKLGHTSVHSAQIITGDDYLQASKERTRYILESLSEAEHTLRQGASLSSFAICDNEIHEHDDNGTYQELLLLERHRFLHLLGQGCIVKIIICPVLQAERLKSELISNVYMESIILPRYDQLMKVIKDNLNNVNFQITCSFRLPHDNLIIVDQKVVFIGRKRHRNRGFPCTTQVFDPTIIKDEIAEFDAIFEDNTASLLGASAIGESDYGSPKMKKEVMQILKKSKSQIKQLLKKNETIKPNRGPSENRPAIKIRAKFKSL